MRTSFRRKERGFNPITITITFESEEELDKFFNAVEEPFLDLGYDCLSDLLADLERA